MTSRQNISSDSEKDYLMVDDKKKRRMVSNRESARRSRMRKHNHLNELLTQVAYLQNENYKTMQHIDSTTAHYLQVDTENNVLRAQMMELTDRLQSLNSIVFVLEEFTGFPFDIPEIPDPLMKPWQLPCHSQPIMASANMFQFID